jgi:hypothetical protein
MLLNDSTGVPESLFLNWTVKFQTGAPLTQKADSNTVVSEFFLTIWNLKLLKYGQWHTGILNFKISKEEIVRKKEIQNFISDPGLKTEVPDPYPLATVDC